MTFEEILKDLELEATADRSEKGIVAAKIKFDTWAEGRDSSGVIVQRLSDEGYHYVGGEHEGGNWTFRFVDPSPVTTDSEGDDDASDDSGSDSSSDVDFNDFS